MENEITDKLNLIDKTINIIKKKKTFFTSSFYFDSFNFNRDYLFKSSERF